jgi:O-antigen/teichoic acid export membrane protein
VPREELTTRSSRSALFAISTKFLSVLLLLVSQVILARWLSPTDYGVYAMSLSAMNFLLIFRDFGLSAVGLQKPDLTHSEVSYLFAVNLGLMVLITLVGLALAPTITWFYNVPDLNFALSVMLVAALFGGLSAQHTMLLRRKLRFFHLGLAEVLSWTTGVLAGVTVGYFVPDIRALLTLNLVQQITLSATTIFMCDWRPSLPKHVVGGANMLRFGVGVAVANLLSFITNNLTTIVIGINISVSSLGQFNRAQQLHSLPGSVIASSVSQIIFGSLSRLVEKPLEYSKYYQAALTRFSIVFFALAGFLMVSGEDLILLLFGNQWSFAGQLLRVMAFSLIGTGMAYLNGVLFQSQSRLKELRIWNVIDGVIRISAILLGSFYGVLGIVLAFAVSTTLLTAPLAMYFNSRNGPIKFKDQIIALIPAVYILVLTVVGAGSIKLVLEAQPLIMLVVEFCVASLAILIAAIFIETVRKPLVDTVALFRSQKI